MDGRIRLSGAQYKKSAEVKKRKFNEIIKKTAKLSSFFNVKNNPSTSSTTGAEETTTCSVHPVIFTSPVNSDGDTEDQGNDDKYMHEVVFNEPIEELANRVSSNLRKISIQNLIFLSQF